MSAGRGPEIRVGDIAGLRLPTWEAIEVREYELWDQDRVVVDTAGRDPADCVEEILAAVKER
jgi:hypothetical protein